MFQYNPNNDIDYNGCRTSLNAHNKYKIPKFNHKELEKM